MMIYQLAAWSVVFGLTFMLVGGLVLWAYGARRTGSVDIKGPEAAAARLFHTRLVRWFYVYGMGMMTAGAGLLLWSATVLFP